MNRYGEMERQRDGATVWGDGGRLGSLIGLEMMELHGPNLEIL